MAVKKQIKNTIKIEEEIKKPLLDDYDDNLKNSGNQMDANLATGTSRFRMPTRVKLQNMKTSMQQPIEEEKAGGPQKTITFKLESIDKYKDVDKQKLIEDFKREQQMIKNQAKEEYEKDLQKFKSSGGKNYKNVVMPQYEFDETLKGYREINQPPESMFIGIGWDEFPPDQKRKHYRRFYPKELE